MKRHFRTGVAAAAVLAAAAFAAGPASAQITFDGNILYGNAVNYVNASSATCAWSLASFAYNDSTTNPLLPSPQMGGILSPPSASFVPAAGSIAAFTNDQIAHIQYIAPADTCDRCGAGSRIFQQVCYRGAFRPADMGGDTWIDGWTCWTDAACTPTVGTLQVVSGVQATSHWTTARTYYLQGRVNFPAGTTLTIDPGVVVIGKKDPADYGYIVIERGARILANGTAQQPIVMTSDQASPAPNDWGGLVIQGQAVANCADCLGGASCSSEGSAGSYCGTDDCDDSGQLRYVRIEYASHEIAPNNELNAFTFNAIGTGKNRDGQPHIFAEYCQSFRAGDDGFEWFGGKGNFAHLVAVGGGDDNADWQMGFRGTVQFELVQQWNNNPGQDKGIEADNNEFNFNAACRSNPLIANCDFIGTAGLTPVGGPTGIHLRRGTDVQFFNNIVAFWPTSGVRVEHPETCARGVNAQGPSCQQASVGNPEAPAATQTVSFRTYPNPVTDQARFSFILPQSTHASLGIYDVGGRLIAMALNGSMDAGEHEVSWSPASSVASGRYYYRLETHGQPVMGSFTIVR